MWEAWEPLENQKFEEWENISFLKRVTCREVKGRPLMEIWGVAQQWSQESLRLFHFSKQACWIRCLTCFWNVTCPCVTSNYKSFSESLYKLHCDWPCLSMVRFEMVQDLWYTSLFLLCISGYLSQLPAHSSISIGPILTKPFPSVGY